MIGQVASLIGGDDDPDVRTLSMGFLDRAIDELNMNGIVLTQRKEATFDSLTNGQQTLTFPSDWGWPSDRTFIYDNSNRLLRVIEWKVWEHFRMLINDTDTTNYGVPEFVSVKSDLTDQLIYVFPFIDSSKVGKIIIPYFTRVSRISEVSTFTALPEIREGIIRYAEFFVMRYRYKDRPAIWGPFKADAVETMRRAIVAARRSEVGWHMGAIPDESGNVGAPGRSVPIGVAYIVVSGA